MHAAYPNSGEGEMDVVGSELNDFLDSSMVGFGDLTFSFDLPGISFEKQPSLDKMPLSDMDGHASLLKSNSLLPAGSLVSTDEANEAKQSDISQMNPNPNPTTSQNTLSQTSNSSKSEGEGEPQRRQRGKPKSNAERCRKHRERKKLAEQKVYEDNKNLKRERAELLHTIAQLEFEAQALRGQGYVNISLENELLKNEIKRHRGYIERIANITKEAVQETAEVEKKRLMSSSVESALGQVIGLCYSSMKDSSWRKTRSCELCLSEADGVSVSVQPRYQVLPTGASLKEGERFCVRIDIGEFPFGMEEVAQLEGLRGRNTGIVEDRMSKMHPELDVEAKEVFPYQEVGANGESVQCVRLSFSNSKMRKTMLQLNSVKNAEFHKNAFPEYEGAAFPVQATAFVNTTCTLKPLIQSYLGDAPESSVIQGCAVRCFIIRPLGEHKCLVTCVGTFPLQVGVFGQGIRDPMKEEEDFIAHIGRMLQLHWKQTYDILKAKKHKRET